MSSSMILNALECLFVLFLFGRRLDHILRNYMFSHKSCLMKESGLERRGAGLDWLVGFVFPLLISMVRLPVASPFIFFFFFAPLGESL